MGGEKIFQSTPSVGRATTRLSLTKGQKKYFNPRPPWGGRRQKLRSFDWHAYFNPRPPWGGRLLSSNAISLSSFTFQSTPSVGRATKNHFSEEAPLITFQSTPSVGRATKTTPGRKTERQAFQSTPSVGRATMLYLDLAPVLFYFNPRPPWGGRHRKQTSVWQFDNFNPRPPWGGRRQNSGIILYRCNFNPRPPWGGRQ